MASFTEIDLPAGAPGAAPQFTRALQFDITGSDGTNATGVRAAKVYQRNLDGMGDGLRDIFDPRLARRR